MDGRILALWPGSALHGMYIWGHPRWEDYDYELKEELLGNPFRWLGNGFCKVQTEAGKSMTSYLEDESSKIPVVNPLDTEKMEGQVIF